ncbi:MAG: NADP oxidoreductase [Anaerolineaceae bacterium]|nr:NADP oxidoreductase [Anaerolineaceae bacterium]
MAEPLGSSANPLRVAIIGSGPSGFYAAAHLQSQDDLTVEIDMFDRLPTPYGLVRGGVAPDHQKIKSVTKAYDRIAAHPDFRFYGNVSFGKDMSHAEFLNYYHAIIYAVGAQTDRHMGIPGENLPGSHPATEFVAWYNAHPDFADHKFDLTQENVAVIGLGNVAMDVIRILARTPDELTETDIADYALDQLKHSSVKSIYVLGRRGPAQSAFTNPEIKELGELDDASVIVAQNEVILDPVSRQYIDSGVDRVASKNVEILKGFAAQGDTGKPRKIIMRFCVSPVEIIGTDKVEAIKLVKNELVPNDKGDLKPKPTDEFETIPVGLVFRSVGYKGQAVPDVPFDDKSGTIPNHLGRVLTAPKTGEQVIGEYAVGWIKRGPSGIIGTNKPDSVETVNSLLDDLRAGKLLAPATPDRDKMEALLNERGIQYVTFEDWHYLDTVEQERGEFRSAPRLKFSRVDEMLKAIKERKSATQEMQAAAAATPPPLPAD